MIFPGGPGTLVAGLVVALLVGGAEAQVAEVVLTPDVALHLPGLASPVLDRNAVRERLATSLRRPFDVGPLPDGVALAAVDLAADGASLFALEGWADLAGVGLVGPSDIVARGSGGYTLVFRGSSAGVPPGVGIDALYEWGGIGFLLSFDTAVVLAGGDVAEDEDVVLAMEDELTLEEDLTAVVPNGLDLDGLDLSPNGDTWYFSFDGSSRRGSIAFDDEDIISWSPADGWAMLYDASSIDAAWSAADLSDFAILEAALFADGLEGGDTTRWSDAVP